MLGAPDTMHSRAGWLVLAIVVGPLVTIVCHGKPSAFSPGDLESLGAPLILEDISHQCLNATGDERAFENFKAYLTDELPQCVMDHVNVEHLRPDSNAFAADGQGKVFVKVCEQISASVVCLPTAMAKLKPCLQKDDVKLMEEVVATVPEAVDMACANDGALLQKFTEPAYRSCAMELPAVITECTSGIAGIMRNHPFSQYNQKQCEEIYGMRDCFTKRITECGAKDMLNFFILFYRKLLALTPCK